MSEYTEKFKDPRWQKKRLKILERDFYSCRVCQDSENTLNVHHCFYDTKYENPWDHPDKSLVVLCDECHQKEHDEWIQINKRLTNAIRGLGGTLYDLEEVVEGFEKSKLTFAYPPNANVIAFSLTDNECIEKVHRMFFNKLKLSRK